MLHLQHLQQDLLRGLEARIAILEAEASTLAARLTDERSTALRSTEFGPGLQVQLIRREQRLEVALAHASLQLDALCAERRALVVRLKGLERHVDRLAIEERRLSERREIEEQCERYLVRHATSSRQA